jgi:aldehyde dehydrogenase (NAD+)
MSSMTAAPRITRLSMRESAPSSCSTRAVMPADVATNAAATNSEFGLQAGLFTHDMRKVMRAWDELDVGGVVIGDIPSFRVDNMPYGGVKDSGLGREGIRYAIEDMTEIRLLVLRDS